MRKPWLVAALLALAASCGVETDDRPPTADYVVPSILRPSCGTAACHSSATGRNNVVLDNIADACNAQLLISYLRGDGVDRMPLDSPLPEADIKLIAAWQGEGQPYLGCP
jgi:hypothetical protein